MATTAAEARIRIAAEDATAAALASVNRNLGSVSSQATRLGAVLGSLGASLSAAAVTAWFRGIVDGVDALNDLKDATGASIENLSALEDIGARTGTTYDTVASSLVKFNSVLKDAKPGSDAAEGFKRLGLNIEQLKKLDPAEAMRQTAVALSQVADDGDRARLVQEWFGKSVAQVAPFLKDLAEQGKLVAKVTTEQAEAAEKFNKELRNLEKNATDAGRAMTSDLVTGINAAAEAWRKSGLIEAFRVLTTGTDQFKNDKALVDQTEEKFALEKEIGQLRASGIPLEAALARKKEERLKVLEKEIALTLSYRKVLADETKPAAPDTRKSVGPIVGAGKPAAGPAGTTSATSDLQRYVETLRQAAEKTDDLSAVETARLRIGESLGRQSSVALQQEALLLAGKIDAKKAEDELLKVREKNAATLLQSLAAQIQDNDARVAANRTLAEQIEEMGLTADALDALRLKRLDEAIATERQTLALMRNNRESETDIAQMERRIELMQAQRDLTQTQGNRRRDVAAATESEEFAKTLNSDVKSALSNAFRDTKQPIQAFGDALGNVVYTRLTNNAANALADLLVGNGKPGGGGGLLGNVLGFFGLSFAGGGYTGSGARSGGMDGKGGFMAMLHPQETVVDHAKGGKVAEPRSITIVNHNTFGDVASKNDIRAAMAAQERRLSYQLRRSENYS